MKSRKISNYVQNLTKKKQKFIHVEYKRVNTNKNIP